VSHVALALRAVERGAHVFVEKPLSHSLDGVEQLAARTGALGRVVQVGYNFRFHPGVRLLKELVDAGAVGKVLWLSAAYGQYLPDWRPEQDYRASYTARAALGGGIILDASHELDYALWLLGQPTEVACMAGKVSDLEVDVEDCATVLLRFAGGAQADVHMDFVQRGYRRRCRVAGTEGTLEWDYLEREVRLFRAASGAWERRPYAFEPNDMYVAEVRHFLDCVLGRATPLVGLEEGRRVLRVALAAKTAARERRVERLA
jgi:predicted dehydrogenase